MTNPMQVRKLGGLFPVSAEAFATTPLHISVDIVAATQELMADAFSTDPDVIARRNARAVQEREDRERLRAEQMAEAANRHAAMLERLTDPLVHAIAKHHRPIESGSVYQEPSCYGCDVGEYADDTAEWPCSTWNLIEEKLQS